MADTRPTFDAAREQRLRFLLAEFALGVPTGKQFDCDEMRLLRDDLDAMLGEIGRLRDERDRLAHWLNEVDLKAQHALNAAHTALPRSSTTRDAVVTAWDTLDTLRDCLRAARAARTQPEGSNG